MFEIFGMKGFPEFINWKNPGFKNLLGEHFLLDEQFPIDSLVDVKRLVVMGWQKSSPVVFCASWSKSQSSLG